MKSPELPTADEVSPESERLRLCLSSAQAALAMRQHWTPEYALSRYAQELRDLVEAVKEAQ